MPTSYLRNFKLYDNKYFNMYLEHKEKMIKRKIENKNIFIKKVK